MDNRAAEQVERILLYAEGNFSFTVALCKELAMETSPRGFLKYEIIATDFAKHPSQEINEILDSILQMLAKKSLEEKITVTIIDEVDGTKKDPRIEGQFDKIICNFPTPFSYEKFSMEELFRQIKVNDLLKPSGRLEIRFWVDDYEGKYEYAYRLAKAQKKFGFQLVRREIVDLEKLEKLGYKHVLHSGEKQIINELPMLAVYQFNAQHKKILLNANKAKSKLVKNLDDETDIEKAEQIRHAELNDEEYEELSDSENMQQDGMPARWPTKYAGSSHPSETLNIKGVALQRYKLYAPPVNSEDSKIKFLTEVKNLIIGRQYRKAERLLTSFLESGPTRAFNTEADVAFFNYVVCTIDQAYEQNTTIKKPSDKALHNYHQYEWYAKLKVLTGVKIPELSRKFSWQ